MQPPDVQALADPIVATIRDAWDGVLAEQERIAADPRAWRRRRFLLDVERSVSELMDTVDTEVAAWLRGMFPLTYGRGAADSAASLGRDFTWTQPHAAAVRALAGQTWDDVLRATRFVRRSTKQLVREVGRVQTGTALLGGRTATQAGRSVAEVLRANGIRAITYRDGSRHGLGEYGEMLVRTRSAMAYNEGSLGFAVGAGVRFFEVFDGFDCGWLNHDDGDKANGTVRTAAECSATPLSHPNCRRSFGPRPDARSTDARPSTTAAQREDARRFEAGLAERVRARSTQRAALDRHNAALVRRAALLRR